MDTWQRAAPYQIHKGKPIYFYCGLYSGIDLDYIYQVWEGTHALSGKGTISHA